MLYFVEMYGVPTTEFNSEDVKFISFEDLKTVILEKGDYIKFIDSCDEWEQNAISEVVNRIKNTSYKAIRIFFENVEGERRSELSINDGYIRPSTRLSYDHINLYSLIWGNELIPKIMSIIESKDLLEYLPLIYEMWNEDSLETIYDTLYFSNERLTYFNELSISFSKMKKMLKKYSNCLPMIKFLSFELMLVDYQEQGDIKRSYPISKKSFKKVECGFLKYRKAKSLVMKEINVRKWKKSF